jgi:DNA-binding MltR family transcriptional regulator
MEGIETGSESSGTFNPMEYPEIRELIGVLFDKLLSESGRGAVLIGTAFVDDHLKAFISAVLPDQNKKYQNKILEYPGPLCSFASRIELCYAFRYISTPIYNSLNALRTIRNDAAHGSNDFNFSEIRTRFDKIFSFIGNSTSFVKNHAMQAMVDMKLRSLKTLFQQHNLSQEDQEEQAKKLLSDQTILKNWKEEQLPHWELIIGLSLLCGMLSHSKEQLLKKLTNTTTWDR